jgi:type VI secretion system protein ImpA
MMIAEDLLKPVSEGAPCGEDLSYDPGFQALETMARGTPETQFSEAKPPDWKEVRSGCLELFTRAKDLRVAVILSVAELELEGLPAFREVLVLIKELLTRRWADVHPQLDPGENNDPLERMNIVASMATPIGSYGDHLRVLERLRNTPLCNSIQMGTFNLSDILRAETGTAAEGDKPPPNLAQIEAAFRDSNRDELTQRHLALTDSVLLVKAIDEFLTQTVGASSAPDLTPLSSELISMRERIAPYLPVSSSPLTEPPGGSETIVSTGATQAAVQGELRSREDVVRLLKKICDYYARAEPSSPVPLILKRALRLAEMDFVQIIKDMAPDAISEVYRIAGETEE